MRVSRGIYRLVDLPLPPDPDLAVVAAKVPSAVICMISALAFHELTLQIPHEVDLALPPGSRTPKLDYPRIHVYRFSGPALTEGIEEHDINGAKIRIYSAAKSVADCFKFRWRVGLEPALDCLQTYLRRPGRSMDELEHFA